MNTTGKREIKFRAWDKKENRMREVSMLDTSMNGIEHQAQYYGEGNHTYLRDIDLMQFTGLKDKNGIEIYEGDILQWFLTDGVTPSSTHVVKWGEWDNGHDGSYTGFELESSSTKIMEVIGNIYENPELL
jgi:hypothetical protein